ncbi:DNA polymerase delta subunit 3 isoform X2 [Salarias fasciatus]|uniref:DNA polymerase delta subunit 3 isoform X2 n=1 Tax=Salarias fasciatus TaxID=181472 RepID=UPI00117667A1|nr:DNA polymerase delta subunit 3 isoform X2 [Salarias fasciatus]
MDQLYLDNIDEYVNDHDKIVTYKWLSLTLGVHVNTAKQMLFHYLDHKRKESSAQLHATYLVSGKFVDNGQTSHRVSVVREEQLEDFKSKMSPIVSVHVYSVQKALLKDSGPLYSVDYDAVKDNLQNCSKYSAIRCASAEPMSSLELQLAREKQQAPAPEPETKRSGMNGDTGVASKPCAKPQKGIMGMFSNKPKNQESVKEVKSEQKEEAAVEPPKSKPAAKTNPMMNFFGNQTAKKADKPVKQEDEKPAAAPPSTQAAPPPPQSRSKPEEEDKSAAGEPQKDSKKDSKKDSRSKAKRVVDSDSDDEKMEKKKRRRIKKPEPDSSDEDVIPDSPQPTETKEKTPSPKKQLLPVTHSHGNPEVKIRKRRRVLKSRNFVDDEGCMVTEKVYESESYSDSEDDFKAAKPAPKDPVKAKLPSTSKQDEKKSQKKASANKTTKQASIMGFFHKK